MGYYEYEDDVIDLDYAVSDYLYFENYSEEGEEEEDDSDEEEEDSEEDDW